MSDSFYNEPTTRVRGLSRDAVSQIGQKCRWLLCPSKCANLQELDWIDLIERRLPMFGIEVCPVERYGPELNGAEGLAQIHPNDLPGEEINILLSVEHFDALYEPHRLGVNRARATLAHEIGHAVLHVDQLREAFAGRSASQLTDLTRELLTRKGECAPYECAEWQAWEFAYSFVAPLELVDRVKYASVATLAAMCGVSHGFMRSRLRRVRPGIPEY